ncbi:MAG: pantetheine-phosphate adenylyltransferase [Planctomycetes bacterium]|jgi:pantetheine-phosphate adenylyltransferase|nr:pantetheine-phosphate adenylyltransferase [Planctomycetota bacterium]
MADAVYPGTFDPVTNGHLDLVRRGSRLFGKLLVLVARNPRKAPLFTAEERVGLMRAEVSAWPNVTVEAADGLTVDFVRRRGFDTILRGVRTVDDFVSEYQMALTNRALAPDVETVFVMPSVEWSFLSSSLIREVVQSGGDVSAFVPRAVSEALRHKLAAGRDGGSGC